MPLSSIMWLNEKMNHNLAKMFIYTKKSNLLCSLHLLTNKTYTSWSANKRTFIPLRVFKELKLRGKKSWDFIIINLFFFFFKYNLRIGQNFKTHSSLQPYIKAMKVCYLASLSVYRHLSLKSLPVENSQKRTAHPSNRNGMLLKF